MLQIETTEKPETDGVFQIIARHDNLRLGIALYHSSFVLCLLYEHYDGRPEIIEGFTADKLLEEWINEYAPTASKQP